MTHDPPPAARPDTPAPAGLENFRDLGGIPAGAGRRVRYGLVYRSDSPQHATDDGVRTLVEVLGVRTQLDLRRGDEVGLHGSGGLASRGVRHVVHPVRAARRLRDEVPVNGVVELMSEHYLAYLETSAPSLVAAVRLVADPEARPILVHCAAGKDRTGVVSALVLSVAGVPDAEIAREYGCDPDGVARVVRRLAQHDDYAVLRTRRQDLELTDPATMLAFLGRLRAAHGSPRAWLEAHGCPPAELDRLADTLTEPA